MAKQLLRRTAHHVGLAVATGHQKAQYIVRHGRDRRFIEMERHGCGDELDLGVVVDREHPLGSIQPDKPVAISLVTICAHLHARRDGQTLLNDVVPFVKGRFDVEKKVRGMGDFIVKHQFNICGVHGRLLKMEGEVGKAEKERRINRRRVR